MNNSMQQWHEQPINQKLLKYETASQIRMHKNVLF